VFRPGAENRKVKTRIKAATRTLAANTGLGRGCKHQMPPKGGENMNVQTSIRAGFTIKK
jgi:hypothetical protein